MAGIGVGMLYLAYSFGLYGYCLFRGYDVTLKQLFSTSWPPNVKPPSNAHQQLQPNPAPNVGGPKRNA